ncbi:carboxypeptidase-like regulatory domain-containing protein [Thiorhodospira sibirica]|uniref:carboxypeptidase-like regulatory domain-containing protein n=1 Tax=Thiorhodospira sibirica TaxID=154347 RepID=UPI00022C4673|nr:carboxypeptidase-like regulatory domain-containing protein [Thiorhodospira sibirica]
MNTARYARFLALMLFLILGIHASTASEVIYLDPDQDRWVVNNAQSIYALPGHDYANTLIILENAAAKITEIAPSLVNQLRFQLYPGQDYFYQHDGQELIIYSGTQRILSVPLNNEGRSEAYFRVGATGDFHVIRPHALEGYAVGTQPLVATRVAIYDEDSRLLATVMTDANGFYRYPVSAPGNYHVVVEDSGFDRALTAVCDPQNQQAVCHVTPFSTLTEHLITHHGYALSEARYAANSRLCDCTDCLDPFAQWAEYFAFSHTHDALGFTMLTQEIARHRGLEGWLVSQAVLPASGIKALQGTVKLASILPIRYGEVRLVTDTATYPQMAMTDATGAWVIPLHLLDLSHLNPLRIEVDFTRGRISETFSTSLSAETLAAFAQSADQCAKSIEINVFTTLADRYQQATGADAAQTQRAIQRYFNMPASIDLSDTRSVDRYYSRQLFFDEHTVSLKFDQVIAEILLPRKAHLGTDDAINLLGAGFKSGALAVLGAGSQVAFAHLSNALGFPTADEKIAIELSKIRNTLYEMNTSITEIKDSIKYLDERLFTQNEANRLRGQATTYFGHADRAKSDIETSYDELITLLNWQGTALGPDDIQFYIEYWKSRDIPAKLNAYVSHIYTNKSGNAFDYLTQALSIEISASKDKNLALANAYSLLNSRFLEAMDLSIKAIIVQSNALNWNPNLNSASFNFENNLNNLASQFLTSVKNNINAQVDTFLMQVERLVVATADTRTIIVGGEKPMFPDSIHAVFRSADSLAKAFNPEKYDAVLVVRVIGDPTSFYRYVGMLPVGNSPSGITDPIKNWNGRSRLDNRGDISYLRLNNENVRSYTAPIPSGYSDRYIGWRWIEDNKWEMDASTNQILVTKFKIPSMDILIRNNQESFKEFNYDYGKLTYSNLYPYVNNPRTIEIKKEVDTDILFGHTVVVAREIPRFYEDNRNVPNSLPGILHQTVNQCFDENSTWLNLPDPLTNRNFIQSAFNLKFYKSGCDFINSSSSSNGAVSFFVKNKIANSSIKFDAEVNENTFHMLPHHNKTLTQWSLFLDRANMFTENSEYNQGYMGAEPILQRYLVDNENIIKTISSTSDRAIKRNGSGTFRDTNGFQKITFQFNHESKFPPDPFNSVVRFFGRLLGSQLSFNKSDRVEIKRNLIYFEMKVD